MTCSARSFGSARFNFWEKRFPLWQHFQSNAPRRSIKKPVRVSQVQPESLLQRARAVQSNAKREGRGSGAQEFKQTVQLRLVATGEKFVPIAAQRGP
jgi:hypothetical protein